MNIKKGQADCFNLSFLEISNIIRIIILPIVSTPNERVFSSVVFV